MKPKAYLSFNFGKRNKMQAIVEILQKTLTKANFETFVFVDHYRFESNEEKEMMCQAMKDIESSRLLIAETTYKGIGIGVEVGYAKGKGIPVIYLRQKKC